MVNVYAVVKIDVRIFVMYYPLNVYRSVTSLTNSSYSRRGVIWTRAMSSASIHVT